MNLNLGTFIYLNVLYKFFPMLRKIFLTNYLQICMDVSKIFRLTIQDA